MRSKIFRRQYGYEPHLVIFGFFYVQTPGALLRVRVRSHNYYVVLDELLKLSLAREDAATGDSRLSLGYYDQG